MKALPPVPIVLVAAFDTLAERVGPATAVRVLLAVAVEQLERERAAALELAPRFSGPGAAQAAHDLAEARDQLLKASRVLQKFP